ncbi:hypothetical protein EYC98_14705 [Halieaceae bacterium IMCC14734]|uniref:Oligosaccharide repeat unit polymerase n=1 Tax=Candidatus Litorirhabdus singularis TaxID=2518993 RepID=A0ABT3TL15_9GAMM|nr:hypothetical protein [Candidatus Litorirhabdus singularis]MCX2982109.1 hypothetical protein [Candidatus Litorirhabdus singularis]
MKYLGEARYAEFDVGLLYRLFGLSVICASIFIILKLYAKNWILFYLKSKDIHQSVERLFTPLMYCIFGVTTFFMITGSILGDSLLSAAQITLILSGYFISLYYFALFGTQQKALRNELLFVCAGLAITYYSGQRFALLLSILILVFARISRIQSDKKRKSMVLLSMLMAPLALMMTLGPLTEMTKTRYGGVNMFYEIQRTDFADFVAAASTADYKENVFTGLYTSVLWAIPGGLIDKEKLDWSMEPFFKKNHWRSSDYREGHKSSNIDYGDSMFSSGAMVGGFIGALLFPLAWYAVFIIILGRFRNTLLLSFYLASVPSMWNIEIAFWTIVPTLRNWVVVSLILFVIIQSIIWLRLRRRRNFQRRLIKNLGTFQYTNR